MNALRGALFGALIGSVAGSAWSLWGASGLDGAASAAVSVLGILIGAVLVVLNRLADRALARLPAEGSADPGPVTRFGRGYWLVVAAEVVSIWVGLAVLNATGLGAGRAPWVCFVVGVHFVALGVIWRARPLMVLALGLIAVGLVLLIVALTGAASLGVVTAWTGILAAGLFFASSVATLLAAEGARKGAAG